jgi:hypothetical protein
VTATITDDLSGVAGGDAYQACANGFNTSPTQIRFMSPSGQQFADGIFYRDSGDVHTASVSVPQFAEAGEWTADSVYLIDCVRNSKYLNTAELAALGFPTSFTIEGDDITPPVVNATIHGVAGANGWYRSDVTVSWQVTDPESAVTTMGCDTRIVTTDTQGVTFTCSAESGGGVTTEVVTIKRDATLPILACSVSPSRLWPANLRLVSVNASLHADDATSQVDRTWLSAVAANQIFTRLDVVGFKIGTLDTQGWLRAIRLWGRDRIYTLTYETSDVAGNTTACSTHVLVERPPRR